MLCHGLATAVTKDVGTGKRDFVSFVEWILLPTDFETPNSHVCCCWHNQNREVLELLFGDPLQESQRGPCDLATDWQWHQRLALAPGDWGQQIRALTEWLGAAGIQSVLGSLDDISMVDVARASNQGSSGVAQRCLFDLQGTDCFSSTLNHDSHHGQSCRRAGVAH